MESQRFLTSHRPPKWEETFLLKRIQDADIRITLDERNKILEALERGARFIQINKHTVMVNSIRSIDPEFGEKNIPPKPKENKKYLEENGVMKIIIRNQKEIDEWEDCFGKSI